MRVNFPQNGWKGSLRQFTSSFSWNDKAVLNIDGAGRWISIIDHGRTYRRTLDGSWMVIQRSNKKKIRERIQLSAEMKSDLYVIIRTYATSLSETFKAQIPEFSFEENDPLQHQSYQSFLERIIDLMLRDPAELDIKDKKAYDSVYVHVEILPPDRYGSLVLQATEGCSYNKCTFCDFYRTTKYHKKSPIEFQNHVGAVRKFIGDSLGRFHSVFLGDANALTLPQSDLRAIFKIIHESFDMTKENSAPGQIIKEKVCLAGIYSFLDAFTGHKKSAEEFEELAKQDLRMVYLGIESGSQELLKFLKKPNKWNETLETVRNLQEGSIKIAAIVLIGAGGEMFTEGHIADTIDLLKEMKLSGNDIVYFSKLYADGTSDYLRDMINENISPLSEYQMDEQIKNIRKGVLEAY